MMATAASVAILGLGIGAVLSQPPETAEGNILSTALSTTAGAAPATEEAKPESKSKKIRYTVLDGDNLWVISQRVLGDATRSQEIARENGLTDVKRLKPGTVLTITVKH